MNCDYFWLTRDQFARLKPLLPTDTRGKPRVDDRRVISGIVHVLKSAAVGSMLRPSMVHARPSTIASCAGQRRAFGSTCSTRLLRQAARQPRC